MQLENKCIRETNKQASKKGEREEEENGLGNIL